MLPTEEARRGRRIYPGHVAWQRPPEYDLGLGGALAAVFAAALLGRAGSAGAGAVALILAGAVAVFALVSWRRTRPVAALAGLTLVKAVVVACDLSSAATAVPVVVGLYTVAVLAAPRVVAAATGTCILTLAAVEVAAARARDTAPNLLPVVLLFLLGAVTGYAVRNHRAYLAEALARAERAEASLEEEARRRVAEHRVRIARDLHDSIAHRMAVINVQTGVAKHFAGTRPEASREALEHVERAAQEALAELSAVVSALRDGEAPTLPGGADPAHSGFAGLADLIGSFAASGMAVAVELPERETLLPRELEATAYRIVQEALTNAHKHAPGARVRIHAAVDAGGLTLEVSNGPSLTPPPRQPGRSGPSVHSGRSGRSGHGLVGMRERVTEAGGTLTTGPTADGGYAVRATLPAAARGGSLS